MTLSKFRGVRLQDAEKGPCPILPRAAERGQGAANISTVAFLTAPFCLIAFYEEKLSSESFF